MDNQKDSIIQLLEMLDNPEAYSEQEILDIINRDDASRETYQLMVDIKRSLRDSEEKPVDVDAAWQRFERERSGGKGEMRSETQQPTFRTIFRKVAATIIGVILVGGIALAAIHVVKQLQKPQQTAEQLVPRSSATESVGDYMPSDTIAADSLATPADTLQVVTYDNLPLGQMLAEIAAYYTDEAAGTVIDVVFRKEDARQYRFHFVWNREQTLDRVVDDLNHFERIHVTLKDQQLIVE